MTIRGDWKPNDLHVINKMTSALGKVLHLVRPRTRPRATNPYRAHHREPKSVQNAKIAAAGEKRMRRRLRPQGSSS